MALSLRLVPASAMLVVSLCCCAMLPGGITGQQLSCEIQCADACRTRAASNPVAYALCVIPANTAPCKKTCDDCVAACDSTAFACPATCDLVVAYCKKGCADHPGIPVFQCEGDCDTFVRDECKSTSPCAVARKLCAGDCLARARRP